MRIIDADSLKQKFSGDSVLNMTIRNCIDEEPTVDTPEKIILDLTEEDKQAFLRIIREHPIVAAEAYPDVEVIRTPAKKKRPTGRWLKPYSEELAAEGYYLCSCCNYNYQRRCGDIWKYANYCPRCGADMEADDESSN